MRMTTPEGSSYEYTNRFMQEMSKLVDDSIPDKKVSLVITAGGSGGSATNSGFIRLSLKNPDERKKSQKEIC
jgi:multidrug efflux pump